MKFSLHIGVSNKAPIKEVLEVKGRTDNHKRPYGYPNNLEGGIHLIEESND